MAAIAAGSNFSTLSEEGISLNTCYTIDTINKPEYPAMPFLFGQKTIGLDGSDWIFCEPAANYAIGTVVQLDVSWNATAITTAGIGNAGNMVGVMSQVASVTTSPTTTNYDGVWVQIGGLCPAISVVSSTSANAQLYSSTTAGALSSSSGGGAVAIEGITITTASTGAANKPGIIIVQPEIGTLTS
jgi:hypothetical protein